jgi:hypothetical protein
MWHVEKKLRRDKEHLENAPGRTESIDIPDNTISYTGG